MVRPAPQNNARTAPADLRRARGIVVLAARGATAPCYGGAVSSAPFRSVSRTPPPPVEKRTSLAPGSTR
jgi:hypothetical protein